MKNGGGTVGAVVVMVVVEAGDNGVANYGCTTCDASEPVSYLNCACAANSGSAASSWTGTGSTYG